MVIKDLWNLHLSQQPCEKTEEEEAIAAKALECQEKLMESLSDEQKALLDEFSELSSELSAITAERAFEKGVSFATGYMFETLGK